MIINISTLPFRGGHARTVRDLVTYSIQSGIHQTILTASYGPYGGPYHAVSFYGGLPLEYVECCQSDAFPYALSLGEYTLPESRSVFSLSPPEAYHLWLVWKRKIDEILATRDHRVLHLNHLSHLTLFARYTRMAVISHFHGSEMLMVNAVLNEKFRDRRVYRWREYWLRALSDGLQMNRAIIVPNGTVADEAVEVFGIENSRFHVVPNGVCEQRFFARHWSDDERLRQLYDMLVVHPRGADETGVPGSIAYSDNEFRNLLSPDGKLTTVFMFIGRFVECKRLNLLIETFARIRSAALVVVGGQAKQFDGEHPYSLVQRRGIDRVFFAGWMPHERVSDCINAADVVVAPSSYEAFGLSLLEAMACGKPVIATRTAGPIQFIAPFGAQANGWLLDIDDVEGLCDAMTDAQNEPKRARLGANAVRCVQEKYSWNRIISFYLDLYGELESISGRSATGLVT